MAELGVVALVGKKVVKQLVKNEILEQFVGYGFGSAWRSERI